jgi:hypothetical protein
LIDAARAQVTDPSGKYNLSLDAPARRVFQTANGLITKYLGGTHNTGPGKCPGTITVQLMPYDWHVAVLPRSGRDYG